MPKGIPTAEEEALQAPAVDPIFAAALGPAFGLRQALESLSMGTLMNQMGWGKGGWANMIPGPNLYKLAKSVPAVDDLVQTLYNKVGNYALEHHIPEEELPDAIWKDAPDLLSTAGYRGEKPQVADMAQRLLQGQHGGEAYPGAAIGRPAGLAAALQYLSSLLGKKKKSDAKH